MGAAAGIMHDAELVTQHKLTQTASAPVLLPLKNSVTCIDTMRDMAQF